MKVIAILDEPVAAALAYGLAQAGSIKGQQNILVYDLGGGTFDLTILSISDNSIKELQTGGDRLLGGKLWDDEIINYVAESFIAEYDLDPREDQEVYQALRLGAEKAKRELTSREKTSVICHHAGKMKRVEISREKFEALTADQLKRTEVICQVTIEELIKKGKFGGWADIQQVLLVGGSSKMPQVKNMMLRLCGKEPKLYDPDLAVAKGAALYSEMELLRLSTLEGNDSKLREHGIDPEGIALVSQKKIQRVSSFALGLDTLDTSEPELIVENDGVMSKVRKSKNSIVIPRNSVLPAKAKKTYGTSEPDQRAISLPVLEGDDPDPKNCIVLGKGIMRDIPAGLPLNSPLEVEFELTEESLIRVSAIETTHGTKCRFELKRETGLSETVIESLAAVLANKRIE